MRPEKPEPDETSNQPEPQLAAEQNPSTHAFMALRRDVLKGAAALASGTDAARLARLPPRRSQRSS